MNQPIFYDLTGWHFLVLALFVATLVGLQAGKVFAPETLRRGPRRDVGFGMHDVALGFGTLAAGMLLSSGLLSLWLAGAGAKEMDELSSMSMGWLGVLSPWAMWGPGIVYLLVRLWRAGHLRLGGVVPRRPLRDLGVAAAGVPVAFILASGLGMLVLIALALLGLPLPDEGHTILETMTQPDTPRGLKVLLIVSAVVVAPITEEFFFRGLLQTSVQSVIGHDKRWLSILPVAVFFGLIHLGAVPWAMVPVLVMLGVLFGWVYERTGSLWCAVLVHAGFNATSVAMSLSGVMG